MATARDLSAVADVTAQYLERLGSKGQPKVWIKGRKSWSPICRRGEHRCNTAFEGFHGGKAFATLELLCASGVDTNIFCSSRTGSVPLPFSS